MVRRVEIPKPDGGTRPLGVAALEDKIVQKAVTEIILTPIYEPVFLGFSYGFRPGRGAHDALDVIAVAIDRRKVNWAVDCDIRKFFDSVSRAWLVRFLERRIGDRRVIRLIVKWLKVGVMVDGQWQDTPQGTPQGAIVSPTLANVYLHYVLDYWFHRKWRPERADGDAIIVRSESGSASSIWPCIRTRPGSLSSDGTPRRTAERGGRAARRRSTFCASRTTAGRPGARGLPSNTQGRSRMR